MLEFILAVPGRRYHEFADLLGPLATQCREACKEITGEVASNGLRLVMAHDPETARQQVVARKTTMAALERLAAAWTGKLDAQDRVRSNGGASSPTVVPRRGSIMRCAMPGWARFLG